VADGSLTGYWKPLSLECQVTGDLALAWGHAPSQIMIRLFRMFGKHWLTFEYHCDRLVIAGLQIEAARI